MRIITPSSMAVSVKVLTAPKSDQKEVTDFSAWGKCWQNLKEDLILPRVWELDRNFASRQCRKAYPGRQETLGVPLLLSISLLHLAENSLPAPHALPR